MENLPTQYTPKAVEEKWHKIWEESGSFTSKADPDKKPFSIVIPPPNITGILHMGHALNNTIQDILIRYKRALGFQALWMPGTDHAGIATQNVVERKLAKEGRNRGNLGREEFIRRVWQWRDEYGSTIIRQLKKIGASCDWTRLRFTMDDAYSDSVREVFIRLYDKGLIFRGNYIVNWCPRCSTALSDEEALHQETRGSLYYLKYPVKKETVSAAASGNKAGSKGGEKALDYIVVATTRPETMLGDTAVAVNPGDKRYKKLIGQSVILPLTDREIPVIADESVDMKFGTGAVKVTPAHDPSDYATGKRHNLKFINILNSNGTLNAEAGKYAALDRFEARKKIILDLTELGLFLKEKPHQHSVGHCYRCDTVIEPYLSWQWFVRMKPLAQPAIKAVKEGKIKFYPKRWTKVYLRWMENIQDWCISRQIWWGHRIPVYYCSSCLETGSLKERGKSKKEKAPAGIIVSKTAPDKCPVCGGRDIRQDEDVLDTWFSSWLWPFATFYWPFTGKNNEINERNKNDLKYFYPTSTLVTAPEIIFFWVARMIMAGYEFMGEKPFSDVYIHGTVRDASGKKMSKSLGNIIDPLSIIDKFGADALRFSLISLTSTGQDVFLSENKFESGRNFANKIWNASRFVIMNLEKETLNLSPATDKKIPLNLPERWILSRLNTALREFHRAMDSYNLNEAAGIIYEFFWHQFCDWYLEMAKISIKEPATQKVMRAVLNDMLRVMNPFIPHITEEIYAMLNPGSETIVPHSIPKSRKEFIDPVAEESMGTVFSITAFIRNIRAELNISHDSRIPAVIAVEDPKTKEIILSARPYILNFARLSGIDVTSKFDAQQSTISEIIGPMRIFLPLGETVDIAREKARITAEIHAINADIKSKSARLGNKEFLLKAPDEIIRREREKVEELGSHGKKLLKILEEL